MDSVQKVNYCTNEPSSQTVRSWMTVLIGRYRHIVEDNIKIDLKEEGCKFVDWIQWFKIDSASDICSTL
jgi:hypothetical protein